MAQAAELVVRLSHVVAPDTPKGLMATRFQQLVAQASEGRIRVDVYPDSQLYGDDDEMEALQLGAVEILAPSLSKFGVAGAPEFEWEETEATDDNAEYFMVFEFRQPFAIAVRGMSVTVNDRLRDRDETAPYLALEDRNISVQAEHVRGLASWVGSTVIDPLDRRRDATVSTPEVQRWRWSAAALASASLPACTASA